MDPYRLFGQQEASRSPSERQPQCSPSRVNYQQGTEHRSPYSGPAATVSDTWGRGIALPSSSSDFFSTTDTNIHQTLVHHTSRGASAPNRYMTRDAPSCCQSVSSFSTGLVQIFGQSNRDQQQMLPTQFAVASNTDRHQMWHHQFVDSNTTLPQDYATWTQGNPSVSSLNHEATSSESIIPKIPGADVSRQHNFTGLTYGTMLSSTKKTRMLPSAAVAPIRPAPAIHQGNQIMSSSSLLTTSFASSPKASNVGAGNKSVPSTTNQQPFVVQLDDSVRANFGTFSQSNLDQSSGGGTTIFPCEPLMTPTATGSEQFLSSDMLLQHSPYGLSIVDTNWLLSMLCSLEETSSEVSLSTNSGALPLFHQIFQQYEQKEVGGAAPSYSSQRMHVSHREGSARAKSLDAPMRLPPERDNVNLSANANSSTSTNRSSRPPFLPCQIPTALLRLQQQQQVRDTASSRRVNHLASPKPALSPEALKAYEDNAEYEKLRKEVINPLSAYNFFFSEARGELLHTMKNTEDEVARQSSAGDDSSSAAILLETRIWARVMLERTETNEDRKTRLLCQHLSKDRSKRRLHRKTHGKFSFTDLSKLISQKWKNLPESEKKFYKEVAKADLRRYKQELSLIKKEKKV